MAMLSFEAMIVPHLQDLQRYCLYLAKSTWDGEDLCQDVLLKALKYYRSAGIISDAKPFLLRTARNLWIDRCRSQSRRRKSPILELPVPHTDSHYVEIRALLEELYERMNERYIEMWLLSEYFGYSMQEIAQQMKCSVPAVKSVLYRAREILREGKGREVSRAVVDNVVNLQVERWARALLHERPQSLSHG